VEFWQVISTAMCIGLAFLPPYRNKHSLTYHSNLPQKVRPSRSQIVRVDHCHQWSCLCHQQPVRQPSSTTRTTSALTLWQQTSKHSKIFHRFDLTEMNEKPSLSLVNLSNPSKNSSGRPTTYIHALNLFRNDITMLQNEAMKSRNITHTSQNFPTEVFANLMILSNILSVPAIVNLY